MKLNRNGIAILAVVGVIALLGSSVVVNVTGILPNQLGQGIQNFVSTLTSAPLQAGSVYGVPFVTDTNQNTMVLTNVQPLSSVSAAFNGGNPVTIYDSSKTAQGAVGDTFYTNINIQNGTDSVISVTLTVAIQKGGASLQTATLSGSGTPCTAPCQIGVNVGQIARGGGAIIADFAGQTAAASSTYNFVVTGGQVCVTFKELSQPLCHPLIAATVNTATLAFSPSSGTTGAFSTSVTGTPSTQQPTGSTTTTTQGVTTTTAPTCGAGGILGPGGKCLYSAFTFWG